MGNMLKRLFKAKEFRILMIGLDAAGKTSILYRMKLGEVVTTIPTIGFNVESITHKKLNLISWDVGGRDKIRPLYRHYYQNTDVLVVVVDSADQERFSDIKEELWKILGEDELREVIVAVFANKQDLTKAASAEKVATELDLNKLKHNWAIFPTSAVTGCDRMYEGYDWIADQLTYRQTTKALVKPLKETAEGVSDLAADGTKKAQSGLDYFYGVLKNWFSSQQAVTH